MKSPQITRGAHSLAKKLGHAKANGFTSAFEGIQPTQANAEALIKNIMENKVSEFVGTKVWDMYNSAGQGVRLTLVDGKWVFDTFLEAAIRTQ